MRHLDVINMDGHLLRTHAGRDALLKANPTPETCEHMTLIVVILCALLRGCSLISKKLQAISTLRSDLSACDDSTRLQLGAPVFLSMVYDKSASVRAAAIRYASLQAGICMMLDS